jgi:hypothetical protein
MKCKCCGSISDTRGGYCFNCADAESIITTGLDMYDKGFDGTEKPTETNFDRLKFLIKKGWVLR